MQRKGEQVVRGLSATRHKRAPGSRRCRGVQPGKGFPRCIPFGKGRSMSASPPASAPKQSGSETRQRGKGAVLVRLLPTERAMLEAKAQAAQLGALGVIAGKCTVSVPLARPTGTAPLLADHPGPDERRTAAASSKRRTEVRPIPNCRAMADLLSPSAASCRTASPC